MALPGGGHASLGFGNSFLGRHWSVAPVKGMAAGPCPVIVLGQDGPALFPARVALAILHAGGLVRDLVPAQQGVQHPDSLDVGGRSVPHGAKDGRVGAVGVFQGVGQDRQLRKAAFPVDGLGHSKDVMGQPGWVDGWDLLAVLVGRVIQAQGDQQEAGQVQASVGALRDPRLR